EKKGRRRLDLSPRAGERAPATRGWRRRVGAGDPWAATAHERRQRTGKDRAQAIGLFPLPGGPRTGEDRARAIGRRTGEDLARATIDFWRNRPVAGGPRTGNLTDQYIPPIPGSKYRNCKPWD
ncbi:hypothetical protein BHM03_00048235, partial [Ensete ventricosum]